MPSPVDEPMDALVRRREAEARAAHATAVARILAIKDPAERMRAYADLTRGLEEGEALPAEAAHRILASLRTDTSLAAQPDQDDGQQRAAQWAIERRQLALLFTMRPIASAGCFIASGVPFVTEGWRNGLGTLLAPWPPACLALAMIAAWLLSRRVDGASSLEGLAGLVVGAFAAGVAGLAVSRVIAF